MQHPGLDIICFSLSRWDSPISSPAWSIAKELSKNHRVFYMDHPYSVKDVFNEWKSKAVKNRARCWFGKKDRSFTALEKYPDLHVIIPPITLPVNFLPPGALYDRISLINEARMLGVLSSIVKQFDIRKFVFINFFDPFFLRSLPEKVRPLKFVYQAMDDISEVPYTARHGVKLEKEIVGRSDLVICTSKGLLEKYGQVGKKVQLLPNGVDIELFEKAFRKSFDKPLELKAIDTPVIGFTGSIDYRTDFDLLQKVILAHPGKTFFFIGPINTSEHIKFGFDRLPNVVFTGAMPIEKLPAFLQYFDCAIIPYKKNKLTSFIYPLKVNEYLAAGLPVVSTDFSEDIKSFSGEISLASNADDFAAFIDMAIQGNNEILRAARFRKAFESSWKMRVSTLMQYLENS